MIKEFLASVNTVVKSIGKILEYFQEKRRKKKINEKIDALNADDSYNDKYDR